MEKDEIKLLVIEDDADIRTLILFTLRKEGYVVIGVATGEEGLQMIKDRKPDLVVLDLMLPGIDGMEVCRSLRSDPETGSTPVIMLTARSGDDDVVTGLGCGADDYVIKPFSPKVLSARIRTLLRRTGALEDGETVAAIISSNGVTVNLEKREVTVDNERVELTAGEFKILHTLIRRPGTVFSRAQLLDLLHGGLHAVTVRAVDVQIVGLRRKLGKAGELIETVRGAGYRFAER